jgi:hypothetical protein
MGIVVVAMGNVSLPLLGSSSAYIIEVAIAEKTGAACDNRPQSLPPSFLRLRDAASTLDVAFLVSRIV